MVWDQYSQEVQDKLESSNDWNKIQREQSLHHLINKIKKICVEFGDHKQEIFNLVQALKMLVLYTQGKKESVKEYSRNFKSLWNTVEAFGGSPGMQKGLIKGVLTTPGRVANQSMVTAAELAAAESEVAEAVKAAMLISRANKARYGRLKEQLANNYLLGTNQYPNMLKKASRILGNYQGAKTLHFGEQRSNRGGLAFIQKGGRGRRGRGAGRGAGNVSHGDGAQGMGTEDAGGGGSNTASAAALSGGAVRTNNAGESHCYHCGGEGHWARECPYLSVEQQEQLHMVVEGQEEENQEGGSAHQFFHVSMLQADGLPDHQAYLNGCSRVMAFKMRKYLENLRQTNQGVKINFNSGALRTNLIGNFGIMKAWYIPDRIANIFSMNELEKKYPITYNSWEGYYVCVCVSDLWLRLGYCKCMRYQSLVPSR
jgi:hypothetical protein